MPVFKKIIFIRFKVKFDSLFDVFYRLFIGITLRDAPRKRGHIYGVASFFGQLENCF